MGAGIYVLEGDPRITRVGRLLRRYSLDELPNLVNVLRGEMAIVGPRPTVQEQVDRYTERQRRRLEVKPGITGWAQVNGRASLPWPERIELDVWYVDNRSLALDVRILLRTARLLLTGRGLYSDTPASGLVSASYRRATRTTRSGERPRAVAASAARHHVHAVVGGVARCEGALEEPCAHAHGANAHAPVAAADALLKHLVDEPLARRHLPLTSTRRPRTPPWPRCGRASPPAPGAAAARRCSCAARSRSPA